MAEKTVELDSSAGIPSCEIIFGQAQFGKYQTFLWDHTGHNPRLVCTGTNDDAISDVFPIRDSNCETETGTINSVNDLDQLIFSWEVIVAAIASGPGQLYRVTVNILQKGQVVPNGSFSYKGALDTSELVYDHVRLVLQ
ncbi:MAG: hypothetical protein ACREBC_34165 [Pyrinomonadaceae bacterium]